MLAGILGAFLLLPTTLAGSGGSDPYASILPLRERAELHDRLLAERLDTIVLPLLRELEIDCWVLVAREYNEDPVLATMLPASWFAARRRTILVLVDRGEEGLERFAVARYPVGDAFPGLWVPEEQPDQWKRLAELLVERDSERIALNGSERFGLADGLSHFEHEALVAALPPSCASASSSTTAWRSAGSRRAARARWSSTRACARWRTRSSPRASRPPR